MDLPELHHVQLAVRPVLQDLRGAAMKWICPNCSHMNPGFMKRVPRVRHPQAHQAVAVFWDLIQFAAACTLVWLIWRLAPWPD